MEKYSVPVPWRIEYYKDARTPYNNFLILLNLNENVKLAIYGLRQADNNVYLDKQSCKTI